MFFNRKDTRARSCKSSGDCIRSGALRVGLRAEGIIQAGSSISLNYYAGSENAIKCGQFHIKFQKKFRDKFFARDWRELNKSNIYSNLRNSKNYNTDIF